MAVAKQATTIATQAALPVRDLAVEMCARPWIVELSKKSRRVALAILLCLLNSALVERGIIWSPSLIIYHIIFKVRTSSYFSYSSSASLSNPLPQKNYSDSQWFVSYCCWSIVTTHNMLPPFSETEGKLGIFSQSLVCGVATTGAKLIQNGCKECEPTFGQIKTLQQIILTFGLEFSTSKIAHCLT